MSRRGAAELSGTPLVEQRSNPTSALREAPFSRGLGLLASAFGPAFLGVRLGAMRVAQGIIDRRTGLL